MKYFVYFVIAVVAAAIIAGFFIVPSPAQERLYQADSQRLSDLQYIQSEILNYWINKGVLPKALTDLRDDIRGITIPVDPTTNASYGYTPETKTSFSICAMFALASEGASVDTSGAVRTAPVPVGGYAGLSQNWQHATGQVCFDRTIDTDFYKPVKKA